MNKIDNSDLSLVTIMMIYQDHQTKYIECKDVKKYKNDDDIQFGPAYPLSQERLSKLIDASLYKPEDKPLFGSNLLPEGLLAFSHKRHNRFILWYEKEKKRRIIWKKEIEIKDALTWTPAILYFVKQNHLRIYALKSNNRPVEDTQLYNYPLSNINNGSVCLGNVMKTHAKDDPIDAEMKAWQTYFWNSIFTGEYTDDDDIDILRNITGTEQKYPKSKLIKSHYILNNLIH